MRYRILQIMATPGGAMGGLEKHTFALCAALARKHEVHLIADRDYEPRCPANVKLHGVDFRKSRFNPALLWQIGRIIARTKPQIVHAQAGKAASLLRWLKPGFRDLAFVATVHGTKKHVSAYAAMDRVIAVSRQIAAHLKLENVDVILNGVDAPPLLAPEEAARLRNSLNPEPGLPLLLAVGRLVPVKGFDVLLRAFVGLSARLLIAGEGADRDALESLSKELNLRGKVSFLGTRNDVWQLLQAVDACVISSRREGFPLILVEALQAGCPVVSTRVSGAVEWVPAAFLAEPEDVPSLHKVLEAALRDLPSARAACQPVFARARVQLTLEGMVERTEALYTRVLEQAR